MDRLQRKREELHRNLRAVKQAIRAARQRADRSAAAHRGDVSEAQWTRARTLFGLSAGDPSAAMDYIENNTRRAVRKEGRREGLERCLREWWNAAGEETQRAFTNSEAEDPTIRLCVMEAQRFLVDRKLEAWVEGQNLNKGTNPRTAGVAQEASVAWVRAPDP